MQAFLDVVFYTAKKFLRNSVNKNSSKVKRNTSPQKRWKIMQNVDSPRLIGRVGMMLSTQNSLITNMGKDLKISKNSINRYGGQMGSCTSEKNISTVWNVGQFDIELLGCGTSLVQHFGSLKFLGK